jgi:hypothetical protein
MPSELGSLTALTELYLDGNEFTGAVPSELGYLKILTNLTLSTNFFTGEIPTELSFLARIDLFGFIWQLSKQYRARQDLFACRTQVRLKYLLIVLIPTSASAVFVASDIPSEVSFVDEKAKKGFIGRFPWFPGICWCNTVTPSIIHASDTKNSSV